MRKIILTILFTSFIFIAFAQNKLDKNTIIGKWTAVGFSSNGVIYNLETDSLYISPEKYDELISDDEDTTGLKKYCRKQMLSILPFNFNFKKNGNCSFENKDIFERATYAIDELKKIITIFNATTGKFINLDAFMEDNNLYVSFGKSVADGFVILKKVK